MCCAMRMSNTNLQTWVACTAKEKGCPNRPSLSNDRRRSGAKPPPDEIKDMIAKMAKKGMTPSQIGIILRDNHGIPQVSTVTNSKIMRILKGQGLAPTLPEDLYCLIKKAVSVRKHLERNRKDMDSKFRLILIESRIHRLARYYRLAKKLEPNWRYESSTASTLLTK
ncbi:unnamed protein product [Bathycoccus prasinos]